MARTPSLATAPAPYASNPIIPLVASSTYERQVYDFVVMVNPFDASETWMFASGMDTAPEQRIIKFTAPTADVEDNTATWTYWGVILEKGGSGAWDQAGGGTYIGIRIGSVVWDGTTFWLYYNSDDGQAIGLATSTDGETFTKHASNPILTANGQGRDDGDWVSQPAVIKEGSAWTMIYGYRDGGTILPGLRAATSSDGVSFTKFGSGDIFSVPTLYNEFHQIYKVSDGDYLLVTEAGNTSTPFQIWAGRSPVVTGPYSVPSASWLSPSGSALVPGRYHVATAFLYETPGGLLKLFYCGADDHLSPYETNTWKGLVADVTELSASLTTSLSAFWPLSESSGARSENKGVNALTDNATVGNASGVSSWDGGPAGFFVAANSEYLSHASNSDLQAGNIDFTFAFWVLLGQDNDMSLVSKDVDSPANSRDYTIDYEAANNVIRFYLNGGGSVLVSVVASLATRYLVIAEHDAASDIASIEVNRGTPDTQATGGLVPETSSAEFRVGARAYSGFENYADAVINRVGKWNRLLTTDEKDELFSRGAGIAFDLGTPVASGGLPPPLLHGGKLLRGLTDGRLIA